MAHKNTSYSGTRRNGSVRPHVMVIAVVAAMTVAVAAAGPAMADAIERGSKVTTSWGELQTVQINPSSGTSRSGVGTDPNSHRYKDRGGPINFDNDRQRFERKEPDGTVLKLKF